MLASETWSVFPQVLHRLQERHVPRLRADNHTTEADELNTELQRMIDEAESVGRPGGVIDQAGVDFQQRFNAVPANERRQWLVENGTRNDAEMEAWDDYYYPFLAKLRELDERFDFSGGVRGLVNIGDLVADRDGNRLMRITEVNARDGSSYGVYAQPANSTATSGGEFFTFESYSASGTNGWGPVGAVPPLLPYTPISVTSGAWRTATRHVVINDSSRSAGTSANSSEAVPGIAAVRPHRGHLIANTLGGPGNFASGNIVAMTTNANLSQMKTKLEDPVRSALIADPMKTDPANNTIFEVKVRPTNWDPTNSYPTEIEVAYKKLHPIPEPEESDTVSN